MRAVHFLFPESWEKINKEIEKSNSVKSLIVTRSKHPILLTFIFMHHLVSVIKNKAWWQ